MVPASYGRFVGFVRRLTDGLVRHWWFIASLAVAALLAAGLSGETPVIVVAVVYAVVNSGGVWLYCDHLEDRNPAAQRWLQWLAVLLIPVGFVTVFMTPAPRDRRRRLEELTTDDVETLDVARSVSKTPNGPTAY